MSDTVIVSAMLQHALKRTKGVEVMVRRIRRASVRKNLQKRLLLAGLLVVGMAVLNGCEVFEQLIDQITGGGTLPPGGGTATNAHPISGRMEFHLAATIWQNDRYTPISSYAGYVGTIFWSGAGVYDIDSRLFNAYIWDGGDFSGTAFMAWLSEDQKTIVQFVGNQTQANIWGAYTHYDYVRGINIPFSHVEGNSRYYRIEGAAAHALITELEYRMWVPTVSSYADPQEWIVGGPAALTGGGFIEIRLDYANAAVPPT